MIIREAKEQDAESIVNININGWVKTYHGIFPNEFLEELEQKKSESIEKCKNKINEYIVCEMENKVVGFLRCGKNKKGYDEKYAEVYALYVDFKYKRMGIGRKLLKYSFNKFKDSYDNVLVHLSKIVQINSMKNAVANRLIRAILNLVIMSIKKIYICLIYKI